MFEKEAEEFERRKHYRYEDNDYCGDIADGIIQAYQQGAEFGYNKAFVEADKNLKAIVTDFNKANEWHRVSDKLPEMDMFVYLWKKGEDFPVVARRHIPYGQKEWVWDCMWGSGYTMSQSKGEDYLWKEIVLPKEIAE